MRVSVEAMLDKQEVEAGNDISKSLKHELVPMPFTMNHYFIHYGSRFSHSDVELLDKGEPFLFLIANRHGHHKQNESSTGR